MKWFPLKFLNVKCNLKMLKIRNFNLGMTSRWYCWELSLKFWNLQFYVFWLLGVSQRPSANSKKHLSGPGLRELSLLSSLHSRPLTSNQLSRDSLGPCLFPVTSLSRCLDSQSPDCNPGHAGLSSSPAWPSLPLLFLDAIPKSSTDVFPQSPGHQRNLGFNLTLAVNSH